MSNIPPIGPSSLPSEPNHSKKTLSFDSPTPWFDEISQIEIDSKKAKKNIPDTIDVDPNQVTPANQEKLKRAESKAFSILQFAKNHPFVTGAFILGIIILVLAFPSMATAFSHTAGISIGGAKIAMGLGVGIVGVYWGLYLINLSRQAALKNTLEAKIKELAHEIGTKSTGKTPQQIERELFRKAEELKASFKTQIEQLQSFAKNLQTNLQNETLKEKKIQAQLSRFEQIIQSTMFSSLPSNMQTSLKENLAKGKALLEKGAVLNEWSRTELFAIPPELEIPEGLFPNEEKIEIQQRVQSRLSSFFEGIKNADLFSKIVIATGVIFTLLAIPIFIYWLFGFSTVFVLGTVSSSTILQFLGYGFSIIYEGINSANIQKLKREQEELEKTYERKIQENEQILKIEATSERILNEYWKNLTNYARETELSEFKNTSLLPGEYDLFLNNCEDLLFDLLGTLGLQSKALPPKEEVTKTLKTTCGMAAKLFATEENPLVRPLEA